MDASNETELAYGKKEEYKESHKHIRQLLTWIETN